MTAPLDEQMAPDELTERNELTIRYRFLRASHFSSLYTILYFVGEAFLFLWVVGTFCLSLYFLFLWGQDADSIQGLWEEKSSAFASIIAFLLLLFLIKLVLLLDEWRHGQLTVVLNRDGLRYENRGWLYCQTRLVSLFRLKAFVRIEEPELSDEQPRLFKPPVRSALVVLYELPGRKRYIALKIFDSYGYPREQQNGEREGNRLLKGLGFAPKPLDASRLPQDVLEGIRFRRESRKMDSPHKILEAYPLRNQENIPDPPDVVQRILIDLSHNRDRLLGTRAQPPRDTRWSQSETDGQTTFTLSPPGKWSVFYDCGLGFVIYFILLFLYVRNFCPYFYNSGSWAEYPSFSSAIAAALVLLNVFSFLSMAREAFRLANAEDCWRADLKGITRQITRFGRLRRQRFEAETLTAILIVSEAGKRDEQTAKPLVVLKLTGRDGRLLAQIRDLTLTEARWITEGLIRALGKKIENIQTPKTIAENSKSRKS